MKYAAIIFNYPPGYRGEYTPALGPSFISIGDENALQRFIQNGSKYSKIIRYEEVKVAVQVQVTHMESGRGAESSNSSLRGQVS